MPHDLHNLEQHAHEQSVPRVLGNYTIHERIGGGGMGTVYRAFHTRLKSWCALKVLNLKRLHDPRAVARFQREMEAIGRLQHPNIVRAIDAGDHDGIHYLVMDLVDGTDLFRLMKTRGPLPVPFACELIRQAAIGLQYAHSKGLVHRDLKPSNLVLSSEGMVKVLDLGLARLLDDSQIPELTTEGQVMGTPDYMSPEQWEPGHAVDIRSDLYSLGCTFYTLLDGRPPFAGPQYDSSARKMTAHLHVDPPRINEIRSDVPNEVSDIVARLLAKNPSDRYSVPQELVDALQPHAKEITQDNKLTASYLNLELSNDIIKRDTQTQDRTITSAGQNPHRFRRVRLASSVGCCSLALLVTTAIWFSTRPAAIIIPDTKLSKQDPPVFRPGERYELLERSPIEVYWPKDSATSFWKYDQKTKSVWMNCSESGMLQLGTAPKGRFDLNLAFSQNPWMGGIGIYFQGREEIQDAYLHANALFLQPFLLTDRSTKLKRANLTILNAKRSYATWVKAADFPTPNQGKNWLKITVGPQGLEQIFLNDQPAATDVCTLAPELNPRLGADGQFGLFLDESNVILHSATLFVYPSTGEPP